MTYKITFKGLVQGVGFRPYLYRRAKKLGISGFVRNTGEGVDLVLNRKISPKTILAKMPPMARVDSTEIKKMKVKVQEEFQIKQSQSSTGNCEIPPDIFLCPDCLKELRDPNNRRYNYPFISCTNCGPRFSVVRDTPYDRERTSMKDFPLCPDCRREYTNPHSRFYHAETTACPVCGPQLTLYKGKNRIPCTDLITETAKLINQGKIVAIKGIGGFHLVCNADLQTVTNLRKLTGRPTKPYALMCSDLQNVRKIVRINKQEKDILTSAARPIVVLQKLSRRRLNAVSNLDSLGIMLPYTGLHHLLLDNFDKPLVFTSANLPGNPLTTKREEQFVDFVLDNNRKIVNPIDDSVVKVVNGHPLFLRRARGYVPESIEFQKEKSSTALALGAEMNSTISLKKNSSVITSQHLGNSEKPKTFAYIQKTVTRYLDFYDARPKKVITDGHPLYNTAQYGKSLAAKLNVPYQRIQHHQAHLMSVAKEHNLHKFIGIAADGAGYGTDNTIWGGEVFECRGSKYKRIGSLESQPMIGGDKATTEPPRMLLGILAKFLNDNSLWKIMNKFYSRHDFEVLRKQHQENFHVVQTSSTGRILDAAAVLLGFCSKRTYEGEPAITLESNSTTPYRNLAPVIEDHKIETTPLFEYLVANIGRDKQRLAATTQLYLAQGFFELARKSNSKLPIVLSGGVAYNRIITTYLTRNSVLVNKKIPPGDGGISFGQIFF